MRRLFPPPTDEQGRTAHNKGRRERTLLTRNGRISITRRHYHHASDGNIRPVDQWLGLDDAGPAVTRGVRRTMCLLNLHAGSFDHASQCLREAAHLSASKELVRQVVEAQGQAAGKAQVQMLPAAWSVKDCKITDNVTRMYLGCDGVMVPMVTDQEKRKRREQVLTKRKARLADAAALPPLPRRRPGADQAYKEFKVVLHYSEDSEHSHSSITRHNHRMAQVLMSRDGRKLGMHRATQKIANVDGADWIRGRLEDAKLDLDAIGLDFYHLAEHVHQARRQLHGDSDEGRDWAGQVLHAVKHEGYEAMWNLLQETRRPLRGSRRAAIDALLQYIAARRDMIQYPRFAQHGWQIGSGPTEAACKTLPARLKRSGMRWNPANADALAQLTALHQNKQWDAYWSDPNLCPRN